MAGLPSLPNMNPNAPASPAPAAAPSPPGAAPAPAPAAAARVAAAPEVAEAEPLAESAPAMEEVLEQSSDQLLRLVHIEDMVRELTSTVADTREEMHAGFMQASAPAPAAKNQDSSLASRLEELELQVGRTQRKQQTILIVAGLQIVVVAIGFWLLLSRSTSAEPPAPELPAVAAEPAAPKPGLEEAEEPAAADKKKPKKISRRR